MGGWQRERMKCKDLYNIDTHEHVAFHIGGFDGIQIGNYFGGERVGRSGLK